MTRGEEGADLLTAGGDTFTITPRGKTRVMDTVGAGDALTSVLIAGELLHWSREKALARAQDFASAIVGQRGAIVGEPDFYREFRKAWGL